MIGIGTISFDRLRRCASVMTLCRRLKPYTSSSGVWIPASLGGLLARGDVDLDRGCDAGIGSSCGVSISTTVGCKSLVGDP